MGQVASKTWLCNVVEELMPFNQFVSNDIAYIGSWVGTLVPFLIGFFHPARVFGFDSRPRMCWLGQNYTISEYVEANWNYKGVV